METARVISSEPAPRLDLKLAQSVQFGLLWEGFFADSKGTFMEPARQPKEDSVCHVHQEFQGVNFSTGLQR